MMVISRLSLWAQPVSNPMISSNSPKFDVHGQNLVSTDSALYFTNIYVQQNHYYGAAILKMDFAGNIKDSFSFNTIMPNALIVGAHGFLHNDSITSFGAYRLHNDSSVQTFISRIALDFSGYRYQRFFSHNSDEGWVHQCSFDSIRNLYTAFIPRLGFNRPDTCFYFEFEPSTMNTTRADTIFLPNSVAKGMTDIQFYQGHYYGFHGNKMIKYDTKFDTTKVIRFTYQGNPTSHSIPYDGLVLNNKLFAYSPWEVVFDNNFSKTSLLVVNPQDSTWHMVYENPQPDTYEDEIIYYEGIHQIDDRFLLLSTLNYKKGHLSGSPVGDSTDIMIRLVDTATLQLKHEYILSEGCMQFVTDATKTKNGFVILYNATCLSNATPYKVTKLAFFDNQARLLSIKSFERWSTNELSIDVFPNPSIDHFQISLPENFTNKNWTLTLLNEAGVQVKLIEGLGRSHNIDVSELPRGSYLLILHSENGLQSAKKIVLSE